MEKTLVLIKPDAVSSGLIGDIIKQYEINGLKIHALKMLSASVDLLRDHYQEHVTRDFYPDLEAFMMSGPLVAMVVYGDNAVEAVRELNGSTNPKKAKIGSIRFRYGQTVQQNVVHGSADSDQAKREIEIWFRA